MPKHGLSFKHFVGTRTAQRKERKERSVNELLSNSRQSTTIAGPSSGTSATSPSSPINVAPGSSRDRPPHLWEEGESVVHPAELVRRERVAHARAARSVAGPAPPRSWRVAPKPEPEKHKAIWRGVDDEFVGRELVVASEFLRPPDTKVAARASGPPTLVKCCIQVVLQTIVGKSDIPGDEYSAADLADAMLHASLELDIGLRGALFAESSLRLPNDPLRLSDGAIRVLLEHDPKSRSGAQKLEDPDDADWEDDTLPTLAHLSLATYPAPLRLLQDVPRFRAMSLTTLDLAFATLPAMDKLVNVLPPGLRALGLAGVRSGESYASWTRELNALARKMTVLHTLDISHLPVLIDPILHALFGAPDDPSRTKHFPSLRRLGMRGNVAITNAPVVREGAEGPTATTTTTKPSNPGMSRSMVKDVVNRGRKWVDIVF